MVAYSFKQRFIEPILVGLGEARMHKVHPKRQTIRNTRGARGERAKFGGHALPGEIVQLYYAMRTKHVRKIGEGVCTRATRLVIWVTPSDITVSRYGKLLGPRQLNEFARADGFVNAEDMRAFWVKANGFGKFEPWLIEWEPIKPTAGKAT